jgi:hypothetical protein
MPIAMESRKLTFITDQGSVRETLRRALRVRPEGGAAGPAAGPERLAAAGPAAAAAGDATAGGTRVPAAGVAWPFWYVVGVE